MNVRSRVALFLTLAVTLALASSAFATSDIVISQVYGGGGNVGSTYTHDFIELFNRGTTTVSLTGWSVQYGSATGTTWQRTNLTGAILPGRYFLIQEALGAGGTTPLPTPDVIGTISMSATAGKVALVNNITLLTGACPTTGIVDFVGFGSTANCFEGTGPTPAPGNTTAVLRGPNGQGCTDTDNNATDFAASAPTPRNSSSPQLFCNGPSGTGSASPTIVVAGDPVFFTVTVTPGNTPPSTGLTVTTDLSAIGGSATQPFFDDGTNGDATGGDNIFSYTTIVAVATAPGPKSIPSTVADLEGRFSGLTIALSVVDSIIQVHSIQGNANTSPMTGSFVGTTGIVTGVKSNGFFLQARDADIDADANSSEGVFVFTSSAAPAAAAIGNRLNVAGTVQEFIPSADTNSPPTTELSGAISVVLLSTGNPLPAPVTITAADTNPAGSISQLEKYEGMRVHVDSLTAIAPTQGSVNEPSATSTSNGVFYGVITGIARPFREAGIETPDPIPNPPCCVPQFDANPERIRVDSDGLLGALPIEVTTGATITNLTGPLDYGFRSYTIDPDPSIPPGVSGNVTFAAVPPRNPDEFTVASYNLERFFDTVNDPGIGEPILTTTAFNNRLNKASLAIRNVLGAPDILGVEEVENLTTLQALAAKITADAIAVGQPDPGYQSSLVEGNDPGGIDVGFLVKSSVNVIGVTQVGKNDTYINPNTGLPETLWDRPPLVLQATIVQPGLNVTVIVNHVRSLNGLTDPVDGPRVRAKRAASGEWLANYVQTRLNADANERIALVGDFNAFPFNDGYVDVMGTIAGTPTPSDNVLLSSPDLLNPDLTNLIGTLTPLQRYSYSFDGNAQTLDQILLNGNFNAYRTRTAYARLDADFPESYRNDPGRPERLSDHDAPVAFFSFLPVGTHLDVAVPANVTQDVPFTATVTVKDISNNVLTTYSGTIHFTSSDPLAVVPADYTFTVADAGVHTFTDGFVLGTAGAQSVTAVDTLASSITGVGNTTVDCPAISVTATNDGPVCEGATVQLDVTAVAGATYLWSGPNSFSSTLRNPTIPNATVGDSGTYSVAITNDGCIYNGSTNVTVNAIPATPVITPSGSTSFCTGGSVTLNSSSASGNQWYRDASPIVGATGASYVASVAGSYTVIVTISGCSSAASTAVPVTVNPIPATPAITAPQSVAVGATNGTASVADHAGSTYAWTLTGGTITSGQGTASITYTAGAPGTRMTVSVVETSAAGCASAAASTRVMVDFLDVPPSHPFHDFIIKIARNGITGGCGNGNYCPSDAVLRSQMAVFLLRGEHGEAYAPPAATGIFADVTVPSFFADFIEQLYNEGITGGCATNPLRYCPGSSVLRSQMAIFLLRAEHGSAYVPPTATGIFADVPIGSFGADFIEQLYNEGITGGCASNPLRYCPNDPANRAGMAVFLTRTFNLP